MQSADPEFHPVYKALIQRPEMWGVDQRFVFIGPFVLFAVTILGVFLRVTVWAFLLGLVLMVACHIAGRWMYKHEPQILPILWHYWRQSDRYDPLKHDPVEIEVVDTW